MDTVIISCHTAAPLQGAGHERRRAHGAVVCGHELGVVGCLVVAEAGRADDGVILGDIDVVDADITFCERRLTCQFCKTRSEKFLALGPTEGDTWQHAHDALVSNQREGGRSTSSAWPQDTVSTSTTIVVFQMPHQPSRRDSRQLTGHSDSRSFGVPSRLPSWLATALDSMLRLMQG